MAVPVVAEEAGDRRVTLGLLATLALLAAALLVPPLTGWQVWARSDPDPSLPPLHGFWRPGVGVASLPLLLLALAAWSRAPGLARRLGWRGLLGASYLAGLAWLLGLALVDGADGLTRVLGNRHEYLRTARQVDDVGALLGGFVERIPMDAPDNWPTHVAGHPPGMLLFFVGLVRLGLGGDLAAAVVVVLLAATVPVAVLLALDALGMRDLARRVAPFLVFSPAAVFLAVSADAVITAVGAWGLAALARATRDGPRAGWPWAVAAGLLLGSLVLLSYGMPLLGLLALGVLATGRRWWPLPVAVVAAWVPVLAVAALGFAWWEAYPVLVERYWDGLAADRPGGYWTWANLAALAVSAGPMVGGGLAAARRSAPAVLLVAGAVGAVALADLSQMSRAEVERIWLPFVPWLTLALAWLPDRWQRPALAGQLGTALLVQHLLYTSW